MWIFVVLCGVGFSFSLAACSCRDFVVFLSVAESFLSAVRRLNSMSYILSLGFIADAEGDHSARVRECECACERVFLWVFVFACAYLRCFVVLELMSIRIDVGLRIQAVAVVFTRVRSL